MSLHGKTVVLGVTGGIAAYKAAEIASRLVKRGADVQAVMTENAARFVGPATFRALTGYPVVTDMFEEPTVREIAHISLAQQSDLILIAPATANIIGKIACGIADDMLSTTVMAATCPVLLAPAMNTEMWNNPIVQSNLDKLSGLGYFFVEPTSGRLACGTEGVGKLADPEEIVAAAEAVLAGRGAKSLSPIQDLEGVKILVTAGPTREPIDPVRYISNRSSGKMGYALAQAAAERGAEVTLVSGPTALPAPPQVAFVPVETAREMYEAVLARYDAQDAVIAAAAVADFTPESTSAQKIKKANASPILRLKETQDILKALGERKKHHILIGFAAETDRLIENARQKLAAKRLDMIVANDVTQPGAGFEVDTNIVTLVREKETLPLPRLPKTEAAHRILDSLAEMVRMKATEPGLRANRPLGPPL
ncbi:MAG: bifunctional phosphopantothenoylcysteine decarboxylase/phosphopantothenate--cysteine ligase CoaBC [Armatimonadetes bacterium]|nr:bifunctional phosphopantothenoylcysteine decarboxylase/phosphopantothenate--cysteine ligase CoaBC [Armatimonadota bacterium]